MTIEQANKKLILARKKRDKINTEITALNNFLLQKKKIALSIQEKRKKIYSLYLRNKPIKEIASSFKLSTDRIRIICMHMEKQQKKEKIVEDWIRRNSK